MSILRLAVSQSHTLFSTPSTLLALEETAKNASAKGVDLILFPEAYLGGYPRTATFGAAIGAREPEGREQYLRYFQDAIDLGDTPEEAGAAWIGKFLEVPRHECIRGDGTRETLERIAKETGVFLIVGIVEKCAGTLFCAVVYVCPIEGIIGKRRKIILTGSERIIWGQGQTQSLRAIKTTIKDVKLTLASAICGENYMPLLRQSLYSQNVNLYLAPTTDDRETWLSLMRTIAQEGSCFVLSANQCLTRAHIPDWITGIYPKAPEKICPSKQDDKNIINGDWNSYSPLKLRCRSGGTQSSSGTVLRDEAGHPPMKLRKEREAEEDFVSRGGSCIIGPFGDVLKGPSWEDLDSMFIIDVDFDDCIRCKLDLDVGGCYSRNESFRLIVQGLNLNPPP